MKRTSLKISEQTIDDILELIEWGLSGYPEPNDDRYKRFIKLANRLEKSKCKLNGEEWEEWKKWE